MMKEVVVPLRGIVVVVDLDEKRGIAVLQPIKHFDNLSNECYLLDQKTGDCGCIGCLAGDFGFFLERDVLLEPRR